MVAVAGFVVLLHQFHGGMVKGGRETKTLKINLLTLV
jgi:hypothetical protein